jgi:hypothetical protein
MALLPIQDIYYSSEFKKSTEQNYNFTISLDTNIDLKTNERLKFKLINFSMMNSMLNISSYHNNNSFTIVLFTVSYTITIPDGSYTATSLRDWINSYMTANNYPLAFNYDKSTNKYWLVTSVGIAALDLIFYPQNCASLFGFTKKNSYTIIYPNTYYSDTFVNMLAYSKIVLATDMAFETNTQLNFEKKYSATHGIANAICWIPRDVPPFATINYTNVENHIIPIANKNLKTININIMNEYMEYITDASQCYLHFQLITYNDINWIQKIYNTINDIAYYLISIYFKKK